MSILSSILPSVEKSETAFLYQAWGIMGGFFGASLPHVKRDELGEPVFSFQAILMGIIGVPFGYTVSMLLHRRFGNNSLVSLCLPSTVVALGHYLLHRFAPPTPPTLPAPASSNKNKNEE